MNTNLKDNYTKSCDDYAQALAKLWNFDTHTMWWVAGVVGDTLYVESVENAIPMTELKFIVDNKIAINSYTEYLNYLYDLYTCGFTVRTDTPAPNFESFYKGCPRVPQETFDKIKDLQRNLFDLIELEKAKVWKQDDAS